MRKTFLYIILVITTIFSESSFAQRNNRTNQQRRTTYSTAQSKPVETIPELAKNCFIVYEFRNYRHEMGEDKIYIINSLDDNTVYSIDYNTGTVNEEIEGVGKVYEGARPKFIQVKSCGGKLLLTVKKNSKAGVYVYNGKSISTSQKIDNSLYVLAKNDRCALIVCGTEWDKETHVDLWDISEMKKIGTSKQDDSYGGIPFFGFLSNGASYIVSSNNDVWSIGGNYNGCFDILQINNGKSFESPSLTEQEYVASYIEDHGDTPSYRYGKVGYYCILRGDYMYVAYNRRIYRINTNTLVWEEFLKMPLSINNSFSSFGITPDGTIYSNGTEGIQIYYPGKYDKPVEIGRELVIPFAEYFHKTFPSRYYEIKTDPNGNFVILNDDGVYVYNPKGIVGYRNAVGKQVTIN